MSTLTNIQVDIDNDGVVRLIGKAPTENASDLAEMIAKDTHGVGGVHDGMVVRKWERRPRDSHPRTLLEPDANAAIHVIVGSPYQG